MSDDSWCVSCAEQEGGRFQTYTLWLGGVQRCFTTFVPTMVSGGLETLSVDSFIKVATFTSLHCQPVLIALMYIWQQSVVHVSAGWLRVELRCVLVAR